MRSTGIFCLAISTVLVLLGCGTNAPDTKAKVSDAGAKIKDAASATTEAAKAARDEFAGMMSKRLDELNLKYEELKGRAAKAQGQAKTDLDKKVEEAKVKRDAAARKLDELKEAGVDRWEKVKEGMGNALDDLKKAFD